VREGTLARAPPIVAGTCRSHKRAVYRDSLRSTWVFNTRHRSALLQWIDLPLLGSAWGVHRANVYGSESPPIIHCRAHYQSRNDAWIR